MDLEKVVADLVYKVERRFYGKYRGFVVDNADPQHLGRLKVRVPSVLGDEVVTGWAAPCVPYGGDANQGFLFIPEVDAGVWVEFEEGDLEFPIWTGAFWSKPGGESELPKPNGADGAEEDGVQDPPTRKIIKTKKGHTIQFEDADGKEMLTIVVAINEGKKKHVIALDDNGIKITDGANDHEIVLDASGVTISDGKNDNTITMDASSGFAGAGISLNGNTYRVCLDGLITWLQGHKHMGNMGAPTPLAPDSIPGLMQAGILSERVKAE
jgi:uncharacterized protein involved in type VI secretion and phage assembly